MRNAIRIVALLAVGTAALPAHAERPTTYDAKITELAKLHNVPERLVHRVIMRESRYRAEAVSRGNYGLMQIRYNTARGMGYRGSPAGLKDAHTNLTYAVPYLANAFKVAGGNEDRAVRLYASGFYYAAKRQNLLGRMQTAQGDGAESATPATALAAEEPRNPVASLFDAITAPATERDAQQAATVAADASPAEAAPEARSKRKRRAVRTAKHVPEPPPRLALRETQTPE